MCDHERVPDPDLSAAEDPSVEYVRARLDLVSDRLVAVAGDEATAKAVARDVKRGQDRLVELDAQADKLEEGGVVVAARRLASTFGLDAAALDTMLLGVAADLHPRARELCTTYSGGSPRPTLGLALEIAGYPVDPDGVAAVFGDDGPLVRRHLVALEGFDRPLTSRTYNVPDRVTRALWGHDGVDPILRNLLTPLVGVSSPGVAWVANAIRAGARAVYIRERPAVSGHATAAAAIDELGISAVAFDLRRAGPDHHPYGLAAAAAREGGLLDAAVVVGPIDDLVRRDVEALGALVDNPWPVMMVGSMAWDPSWSRIVPLTVDAERPDPDALVSLWEDTLALREVEVADGAREVIRVLRLTPEQTVRAAVAAHLAAAADQRPLDGTHVRLGARTQAGGRLEQLAERIAPRTTFEDLVLPANHLEQVRQIAHRGRYRDLVLDEWQMGGLGSRGRGITALFAGDSGTGKTLSAEAIAGELGVDLYVIDLSTVVDKYIGETEKNLGRVFDEAEGINGILFFDEADALFGKRSETTDAKDRYANVEVAYLLQRMERFDGIAILATNLRSNIDDAFTRRLDVIVHFTIPEVDHRRLLWQRHLTDALPRSSDIDLDFLAGRFELSGGVIRNVTLTAAYRAAERGDEVTMADLVRGLATEYSKMGRLFDTTVLGSYAGALDRIE